MRITRARALALGAATALWPAWRAAPAHAADAEALAELLALEQEGSLVYGTLRGVPEAAGFRGHARAHARGIEQLLRARGGRPRPPRARVGRATPEQALALEARTIAAYSDALGRLDDERLLAPLAGAMGNHGQHAVVLRRALGRDPIPGAFAGEP